MSGHNRPRQNGLPHEEKIPLLVDWGAEAERIEGVLPAARRAERRAGEVARQTERCVSGGLCGR
jgi:hypothetical protein